MSSICNLCPRKCGVDREITLGYCRAPDQIMLARAALHKYEEPVISGKNGSGTVFFCGCNLGCVYCQNGAISRGVKADSEIAARAVSEEELAEIMLRLEAEGAHNINLVTPTHYADRLCKVLEKVKERLKIPISYNCGGYEGIEALRHLEGLVDIYMPDFKYFSPEISAKYSFAPDYAHVASEALAEMYRQVGKAVIDENRMMRRGVIVRHLVLPSCRHDSSMVLKRIAETVPVDGIFISIMRQYTPDFAPESIKELRRRITSFEYDYVISEAEKYGFSGFSQGKDAASSSFTPNFSIKTF